MIFLEDVRRLIDEINDRLRRLNELSEELFTEGADPLNEQHLKDMRDRVSHLEQVYVTFMSESTKQWTEERLRALEHQVKELRNGERAKADSGCNAKDKL